MHLVFGTTPDYTFPYPVPAPNEPTPGTLGPDIEAQSEFDGWGCVRLLDGGSLTEIDELCLDEQLDQDFTSGFGDLTVHEVEVPRGDPNEGALPPTTESLGFSWYAAGFRVASFDDTGIDEVGAFIDQGGNDFWGVALAEDENGDRIVSCQRPGLRPVHLPIHRSVGALSPEVRRARKPALLVGGRRLTGAGVGPHAAGMASFGTAQL